MEKLTDKELMLASIIYMIFVPYLDNKNLMAKRELKILVRGINKILLSNNKLFDHVQYLRIVHEAYDVKVRAFEDMSLMHVAKERLTAITPPSFLRSLEYISPGILDCIKYDKKHIKSMEVKYEDDPILFPSLMYANRILREIDVGLEKMEQLTDEEVMLNARAIVDAVN